MRRRKKPAPLPRGQEYCQVPLNPNNIKAGSLLFATHEAITLDGHSSVDFLERNGGDQNTIIFVLGVARGYLPHIIVEGIFLNDDGPGFHPTWDIDQLCNEIERGAWDHVEVLGMDKHWKSRVEDRFNTRGRGQSQG